MKVSRDSFPYTVNQWRTLHNVCVRRTGNPKFREFGWSHEEPVYQIYNGNVGDSKSRNGNTETIIREASKLDWVTCSRKYKYRALKPVIRKLSTATSPGRAKSSRERSYKSRVEQRYMGRARFTRVIEAFEQRSFESRRKDKADFIAVYSCLHTEGIK